MDEVASKRWRQRFDSFGKCLALLQEAIALSRERALSELEKGGLVQRFETAWEAGWKTLGDYLRDTEDPDLPLTPGSSIRLAAIARLIDSSDDWLNAGKLRNVLSHEYSREQRDDGLELIESKYLPMMERLHANMVLRADET